VYLLYVAYVNYIIKRIWYGMVNICIQNYKLWLAVNVMNGVNCQVREGPILYCPWRGINTLYSVLPYRC